MIKKTDCKWKPDAEYKYFVRDPINDGMLYYRSEALRDEAAAEVIESYLDEHWDEEVENVITGTVTGLSTKYNVSEPVGELDDEGLDGAGEYWPEGMECRCNYRIESIPPLAGRLYAVEFKDNSTGDDMLIMSSDRRIRKGSQ